jgi:hypothetical protein
LPPASTTATIATSAILHWIDEAAHFNVRLKEQEYVFDGVVDLGLRSQVTVEAERRIA